MSSLKAQYLLNSDSAFKAGAANSGRIWGYVFADYYYKAHNDSAKRGGNNQYTGIPENRSAFQSRRIYLGYDYNITNKFSAELLLAAEDNFPTGNPVSSTTPNGDQLQNNKLSFYIKLANIRWKNIWKGTDLVVGQVATPAFTQSEKAWRYRSIERTVTDIRRTPSYDMGASLQGKLDAKGNYGYTVMAGNGSSAKPEGDDFKWFYGDVYAMFLDKKIVVDLYADYQRLNWTPDWHHARNMIKGFVGYTIPKVTVGVEAYINNLYNDDVERKISGGNDTATVAAKGISVFVNGDIVKDKIRFFARYDAFNPDNKINNSKYNQYTGNTGGFNDPTTKEQFITGGLDFTPVKNVHVMPNIWYNNYKSQLASATGNLKSDHDLVYRMTFYYVFGK